MNSDGRQPEQDCERGRAVSDVISFTLMFSIIIIGVGLVSLTGLSQLTTLSEVEEIQSADRGMTNTAATLDDMNRYGDLNRSVTVAFSNSNIWVNETSMGVLDENGDPIRSDWDDIQINSLEQRFDRSPEPISALYEGGASFRSDGGYASYRPAMKCTESGQSVVSVVNLTLADDSLDISSGFDNSLVLDEYGVSSQAPISNFDQEITFDASVVEQEKQIIEGENITLDVSETSQPLQWRNQLTQQQSGDWEEISDNEIECDVDDGTVLVQVTTIELEIDTPRFVS